MTGLNYIGDLILTVAELTQHLLRMLTRHRPSATYPRCRLGELGAYSNLADRFPINLAYLLAHLPVAYLRVLEHLVQGVHRADCHVTGTTQCLPSLVTRVGAEYSSEPIEDLRVALLFVLMRNELLRTQCPT